MKAGIWGTGGIAALHAQALRLAGAQLGAVVDADAAAASRFGQRWQAEKAGDDPALLWTADIDTVHICTPPGLHAQMAREALAHGKHVLCEKPLAVSAKAADELAALAAREGLLCAVNFNLRYHQATRRAVQRVRADAFGPVRLVHGNYLQEFHAFPAPYGWRYNEEIAGPMRAVTEIGSHWVDIAQQVSGLAVQRVCARFGCHQPVRYLENGMMVAEAGPGRQEVAVRSEDSALVLFELEGGVLASCVLCEVAHGRANHLALEVVGQNESLWWNSEDIGKLHSGAKGQGVSTQLFAFGDNGFGDSFRLLIEGFYAALAGDGAAKALLPDFAAGAQIVRVCDAIYRSATANGAWTDV